MSALAVDRDINLFGGRESLREDDQMIASESGPRQRAPEKMPRNGAERGLLRRLSFASQFAPSANARTLRTISHDSSVRSGNARGVRDLLADRDGFERRVRFVRSRGRMLCPMVTIARKNAARYRPERGLNKEAPEKTVLVVPERRRIGSLNGAS